MSRVTIKDLARYLNINPSTVSRALRNHPDVSRELKKRIEELALELGYKPNSAAVNLRKGKSLTIALIIPEIASYFFPNVIKAIEEVTHDKAYNLLILNSNDSMEREKQNADICARLSVDGILVSLTKESNGIAHFLELSDNGVPVVFFDKINPKTESHRITIPGESASYKAITQLLQNHKNTKSVCGIFGDQRLSITQDRLKGFQAGLAKHKIKKEDRFVCYAHSSLEAYSLFKQHWKSKHHPKSFFLMSDEILEGVMKAIYELNLQVGKDLQLITMSDGVLPALCSFRFQYIETSGYTLGHAAAEMLFTLLENKTLSKEIQFIETPVLAS